MQGIPIPQEVQEVRIMAEKYFKVYDVRWDAEIVALHSFIDENTIEEKFELLRNDCQKRNYTPMLRKKFGEYIIFIQKNPNVKYRSVWVNFILLIATIFTTILAGSVLWSNYNQQKDIFLIFSAEYLLNGAVFFALPLMTMLGFHELAHYLLAKKHNVKASLPFFIPVPPLSGIPLGTFGAFISMREPIPNKKALLDIGVAGPIAGFLVAILITIIGLFLTIYYAKPVPEDVGESVVLGTPLIFNFLTYLMQLFFPTANYNVLIHPTAFAGWVGLLVTAMNLLPAGQLDGGHIFRALLGEKAKYASYSAIIFMLIIGFGIPGIIEGYFGWVFFAFLIILLGVSHPPPLNDVSKLTNGRKLLGVFAIAILILCFIPTPLSQVSPEYNVELEISGHGENITSENFSVVYNITSEKNINTTLNFTNSNISSYNLTYNITIFNKGNALDKIRLEIKLLKNWEAKFSNETKKEDMEIGYVFSETFSVSAKKNLTVYMKITVPRNAESQDLKLKAISSGGKKDEVGIRVMIR